MSLRELGEFGLINRLAARFAAPLPKGVEGIGDDCAVIPYHQDLSYLITTDLLAEDIHFLKAKTPPEDLGYKALAVNLSDIAAMGGHPRYVFISQALPAHIELSWLDRFFDGFHQLAQDERVLVLGGDTSRSIDKLFINVLVIGDCLTKSIKRRSAAKPGDLICCTDYLGDSGGGLQVIIKDLPLTPFTHPLVDQHQRPRPHLKEGQWLAAHQGVHAMIDLSDGLDSDLRHILEQSHCGAKIDLDKLPISPSLKKASQEFGWDAIELAATAGEDYCLLMTIDPADYEHIAHEYEQTFKSPLFSIGCITAEDLVQTYYLNGQPRPLSHKGFNHFTK